MKNPKAIAINGKPYTAKDIINAQNETTNGGDFLIELNGAKVIWNYRTSYNPDGTQQSFGQTTVCNKENADLLGIYYYNHMGIQFKELAIEK